MESGGNLDFEKIYEYVAKRIKEEGYLVDGNESNQVASFIDEVDKEIVMDLF